MCFKKKLTKHFINVNCYITGKLKKIENIYLNAAAFEESKYEKVVNISVSIKINDNEFAAVLK